MSIRTLVANLALAVVGLLPSAGLLAYGAPDERPKIPIDSVSSAPLEKSKYELSLLSTWAAAGAFALGFIQYRKSQLWKRAEFLAAEMRGFFGDPDVANVLTMIDWAPRRVDLFYKTRPLSEPYPVVTREIQTTALEPHTLRRDGDSALESELSPEGEVVLDSEGPPGRARYSPVEVKIRDSYDKFLDFLERINAYTESHLIGTKDLDPYLRYWIDDITSFSKDPREAAWTCALINYIDFYDYTGVQGLFGRFGYDISPYGSIYERQLRVVDEPSLAKRLKDSRKPKDTQETA